MLTQCNEFFTIYQGEIRVLPLRIVTCNGISFDLTGCTNLEVSFPSAQGGYIVKTLSTGISIVDAQQGRFTVSLTADDTKAMRIGERQCFSALIKFGTSLSRVVQFERALSVRVTDICL